jgi:hypothetical protein
MMIGPPGPDVDFVPTHIVQVIALPFTVTLFEPVVSAAHEPLAAGSVGEVPPVDPLLDPLLELPDLPPEPELPCEPELEPELPPEPEPPLEPELLEPELLPL